MSKTPMEKPLERLNYYNGMAVDAAGFKTEQDYHIRVRRWLNKSLYSAGIASGLEVRAAAEGANVIVSPGLALDSEGREIILLEETQVEVCSYSGTNASTVVGNYLVIEYGEEAIAYESGSCAVRMPETGAGKSTSKWGGPSRVQAKPKFSWVPFVPLPGANQIVLARVELTGDCKSVYQIDTGARRYVGAASAATVRQYALEGEREVAFIPESSFPAAIVGQVGTPKDATVVGKIYFHVRGRQPNSVTLFLKAEEISTLHYTELATHKHDLSITGGTVGPNPPLKDAQTEHKHKINFATQDFAFLDKDEPGFNDANRLQLMSRKGYIGKEPDQQTGGAAIFLIERNWGVKLGLPDNLPKPPRNQGETDFDYFMRALGQFFGNLAGEIGGILSIGPIKAPEIDDARADILKPSNGAIFGGLHAHSVSGETELIDNADKSLDLSHTHALSGSGQSGFTGSQGILTNQGQVARSGKPFAYFSNLQIAIDGVDQTTAIKDQIVDSAPGAQKPAWQAGLGNGDKNHPIASEDFEAIPIRLDFLPHVTFAEGQHVIEFSVLPIRSENDDLLPNGGTIHYNLYIE